MVSVFFGLDRAVVAWLAGRHPIRSAPEEMKGSGALGFRAGLPEAVRDAVMNDGRAGTAALTAGMRREEVHASGSPLRAVAASGSARAAGVGLRLHNLPTTSTARAQGAGRRDDATRAPRGSASGHRPTRRRRWFGRSCRWRAPAGRARSPCSSHRALRNFHLSSGGRSSDRLL